MWHKTSYVLIMVVMSSVLTPGWQQLTPRTRALPSLLPLVFLGREGRGRSSLLGSAEWSQASCICLLSAAAEQPQGKANSNGQQCSLDFIRLYFKGIIASTALGTVGLAKDRLELSTAASRSYLLTFVCLGSPQPWKRLSLLFIFFC